MLNILIVGAAGTGKTSKAKALQEEFYKDGKECLIIDEAALYLGKKPARIPPKLSEQVNIFASCNDNKQIINMIAKVFNIKFDTIINLNLI